MFNRSIVIMLSLCLFGATSAIADEYKADPKWKIAFVRGKSLWAMNADGTGPREIVKLDNISFV